MVKKKLKLISILFSIILISIDQLSKFWAAGLELVVINHGVSFGWLSEIFSGLLLILLSILVIFLAKWIWTVLIKSACHPKIFSFYLFSAALFFGGSLSNLLDRLLFGGVRDWLIIPFFDLKNNLADYYISISVILLITGEVVKLSLEKKKNYESRQ